MPGIFLLYSHAAVAPHPGKGLPIGPTFEKASSAGRPTATTLATSPMANGQTVRTPTPAEVRQRISTDARVNALKPEALRQRQPEQIAAIEAAQGHGQPGSLERFQAEARAEALRNVQEGRALEAQDVADGAGQGYTGEENARLRDDGKTSNPYADDLADQSPDTPQFNFNKHLRSLIGSPPKDMVDPHAHHILFKEGNGAAQKALVKEGQAILRRYAIDPIKGLENLVWAPNRIAGQHGIKAITKVVKQLKAVEEFGGTQDYIKKKLIKVLTELGEQAARRR